MQEAPIRVAGTLQRVLQVGLAEVCLPNGKITLGHLSRELKRATPLLKAGDPVLLEMTPFDFESARIVQIGH